MQNINMSILNRLIRKNVMQVTKMKYSKVASSSNLKQ